MQQANVVEHREHAKHFHLLYQMCKIECLNLVNPIDKKNQIVDDPQKILLSLFIPVHPSFHEELMLIVALFEIYYCKQVVQLVWQHFL